MHVEIRIRVAKPAHKPRFLHLWKAFMQIHEKMGHDIRATDRSLRVYEALFDGYTQGSLTGVALLGYVEGTPVGVLMCGNGLQSPFDATGGNRSIGWGAYVEPPYRRMGLCVSMMKRAIEMMVETDLDMMSDSALISNPAGLKVLEAVGFVPERITMTLDLNKKPAWRD